MRYRALFDSNIWQLSLVCFLLPSGISQSQTQKYWIFLEGKGPATSVFTARRYAPNSEDLSYLGLTERAIERRRKMQPDGGVINFADIPLHPRYLAVFNQMGIRTLKTSKWLNAVSAELSREQLHEVLRLSFVQRVKPVAVFLRREPAVEKWTLQPQTLVAAAHLFNYGPSLTQVELIRIPELHDMGITGTGVLVGMLDTGFRWKDHEALMNLNVIAEYDFINDDSVTANEGSQDIADQDSHGTGTLSLIGAFMEGQLIGGAFGTDFILGKTEDNRSETTIEEDNWVAGIEWMESQGVDVVNSSLGYFDFDPVGPGGPDYTFADLDGQTAVTSQAANIAASMGVVVIVSAGNNNGDLYWPWINPPSDAFGSLAVGAVSSSGAIAAFSSRGPTSDGRIKPDVVTMGIGTRVASFSNNSSSYNSFFDGTSASAPLASSAAALLLAARPELTPSQVFDALRNSADQAGSPDFTFGWGLVNAVDALRYPTLKSDSLMSIIEVFLGSANGIVQDSSTLYFAREGQTTFTALPMVLNNPFGNPTQGVYTVSIPVAGQRDVIRFYIQASDSLSGTFTIPLQAPTLTFSFIDGDITLLPPSNPSAPRDLQALEGDEFVTLIWTPSTQSNLLRYRIYRSTSSPASTLLDSVARGISFYTDRDVMKETRYFYRITAVDSLLIESTFSNEVSAFIPASITLFQNFPNPFNQGTTIQYEISQPRFVTLKIYNVLGESVASLVENELQTAGDYRIVFSNPRLSSGVYFYALHAGDFTDVKKMVLIK